LIVDHALQPASAAVAQATQARAAAAGIDAEVVRLAWGEGPPPTDQAKARAARYLALAAAARRLGTRVVAVGHTLDDQAETALIKRTRLGTWRAAVGMARLSPLPVWPEGLGLWLARPLLGTRRADLRTWLKGISVAWHEDPANDREAFLRVRARQFLQRDEALTQRLAAFAVRLRERADRLDAAALSWLEAHLETCDGEAFLHDVPRTIVQRRALAALIAAVGGRSTEPSPRAVAGAVGGPEPRVTLAGVIVEKTQSGLVVRREPGALLGRAGVPAMAPVPLEPGVPRVVDGRLLLSAACEGYCVLALPDGAGGAWFGLKKDQQVMPLEDAPQVRFAWLTQAHLQHHLASEYAFVPSEGAEGVQQALGLLS
jgi:tRNA(Ile)-lysidine synthase